MHEVPAVGAKERLTAPIRTPSLFNWISQDTLRTHQMIATIILIEQ